MNNSLVLKFGEEKRWVNFRFEKAGIKTTKVPYCPMTNGKASSTNPDTWSTYDIAVARDKNIGIMFGATQTLLGIDIDHCLDKETREIDPEYRDKIESLLERADTYTEISPSGTGLHLFLEIDLPLKLLANKKAPFEMYTKERYFTVTLNVYKEDRPVRKISLTDAEDLLSITGYPWKKAEQPSAVGKASVSYGLSDAEIVDKMFNSKNGAKIKELYDTASGDDLSKTDMKLLSHLAFWTQKDAIQMERVWMMSPLGGREKTQQRKDYRDRSIANAIAQCRETYKRPSKIELLCIETKDGGSKAVVNTENVCRILREHEEFAGKLRYDEFRNTMEIIANGRWKIIEDIKSVDIQTRLSILFPAFIKVNKGMVMDAMLKVSKENTIDSAKDYVLATPWDHVERIDTWLCRAYGVEDSAYHRGVGSNWLKGLVKRIIEPGCKFDYVLVLEGPQGSRKSTSLGALGEDWHVETTMSTDNKDFFMQFQGKAIIEFSEGETLNKTEVKKMKAIITTQVDKFRPPYERTSQDFPRRCVFAMTTNQEEYLKDETGNRRWWPVKLVSESADVEWISENRAQLMAEAYYRVAVRKETLYDMPKEETEAEQSKRRLMDPNADTVSEWYHEALSDSSRLNGVTVMQAYREALNGSMSGKLDRYTEMAIGSVYREVLGLEKRQSMKNGTRQSRYFLPKERQPVVVDEIERMFVN